MKYRRHKIFEKIASLEAEFGRPWQEILQMYNEPDELGLYLSMKDRARSLGMDIDVLKREYARLGISVNRGSDSNILPIRDKVWVKTGCVFNFSYHKMIRILNNEEELAETYYSC